MVKKIIPLSIVIPSIGEELLFNTLEKLNEGNFIIDEILIIIPRRFYKSHFISSQNYKFHFTEFEGQVNQRIYGFSISKNNIIMQLDCDCVISNQHVYDLYNALLKMGKKNCIAPVYFTKNTDKCIHKFPDKKIDFARNLFTSIICGASYSVMRMGTISKIGNNFGADPDYMVNDMLKSDWLPGGCVLHYKNDIIYDNYYPFKGKAYCEDLIHSFFLRKNNLDLWIYKKAFCFTEKPELPVNISELNAYFRSFTYFNNLVGGKTKIRFFIWLTISKIRYFINRFFLQINEN